MKTIRFIGLFVGFLILAAPAALAQFDSGSDGSNGAFPPLDPGTDTSIILDLRDGIVTFQPSGITAATPGTPAGGFQDGILRFTTMDVPAGVTWSFIRNDANSPVTILASGDVTVTGTIDVRGQNGSPGGANGNNFGGQGGSGGLKGGSGELRRASTRAGAGLGLGGGLGGGNPASSSNVGGGGGGGFGAAGAIGAGGGGLAGAVHGQPFLLPLIGGSGGGGGSAFDNLGTLGAGGGGGGGAILIASSTSIDVSGTITARGGNGGAQGGGGGSGGAIRLMSETISGAGALHVGGGSRGSGAGIVHPGGVGGVGRMRLEARFLTFTGTITGVASSSGGPALVFLPSIPVIRIVSVDGDPTPDDPIGVFGGADIVVDAPGTVPVVLEAQRVPVGTTIQVTAKPESETEVIGPITSPGLTLVSGETTTTTVDIDFPVAGVFFLEARATFALAVP